MIALFSSADASTLTELFLSFAGTWFVQATVLLGLCALFARRVARGSAKLEEGLWKTSVVGSLLATLLILGSGWQPLGGRTSLAGLVKGFSASEETTPVELTVARESLSVLREAATPIRPAVRKVDAAAPATAKAMIWSCWISLALAGGALFGLLRLLLDQRAFTKRIAHRRLLGAREIGRPGRLAQLHRELLIESGLEGRVALSASARLQSPIAFGLFKREVCVPVRAIGDLEVDEQRAMLAHEVAHAARRDPAWITALRVLRAVFWFQPLLAVAERRLHELFELRCDRRAAQLVEDPLALASCLTEVAAWIVPPIPKSVGAAGMSTGKSCLGDRVDELLALKPEDLKAVDQPAWRSANFCVATLVLLGVASASPAIGSEPLDKEKQAALIEAYINLPANLNPPEVLRRTSLSGDVLDLDSLLTELDVELLALRTEFEELSELARSHSNPAIDVRLSEWGERLQSLQNSRSRLEAVLSAPSPLTVPGSQAAPARTKPDVRALPRDRKPLR